MPPKRAKRARTNMQTSPLSEQSGSGAVDLHHNMPSPPPSEQESGVVNPPQPEQGESVVRLRGGNTSESGRVEVSHDGANWGTVCDDSFDHNNNGAKVVCRMLGYPTSRAQHYTASGGSGPIFLDGVNCTGSESSLLYCKHNRWNDENCSHSEDIGVRCD